MVIWKLKGPVMGSISIIGDDCNISLFQRTKNPSPFPDVGISDSQRFILNLKSRQLNITHQMSNVMIITMIIEKHYNINIKYLRKNQNIMYIDRILP